MLRTYSLAAALPVEASVRPMRQNSDPEENGAEHIAYNIILPSFDIGSDVSLLLHSISFWLG